MTTLTKEQANDVQEMLNAVEAAYKANEKCRTALSGLILAGRATCQDVSTYNLSTRGIYAYQSSVAAIIRATGGQAPVIPPPRYIGWKGVQGAAAIDIDCSSPQMRGLGTIRDAAGDTYVNPAKVEWIVGATDEDKATAAQAAAWIAKSNAAGAQLGNLGLPPAVIVVVAILATITVTIAAYAVIKIAEYFSGAGVAKEQVKMMAVQRAAWQDMTEKRWACYQDCVNRGTAPEDCGRTCDRLVSEFKPNIPGGGLGIVGTLAGVAVFGLLVYGGYRFVSRGGLDRMRSGGGGGGGGGGRRALPAGVSDEDVIDAEYAEA